VRALVERLAIRLVGVVFTGVKVSSGYGYGYRPDSKASPVPAEIVADVDGVDTSVAPVEQTNGPRRRFPASRR
jgi:hypothetical protein